MRFIYGYLRGDHFVLQRNQEGTIVEWAEIRSGTSNPGTLAKKIVAALNHAEDCPTHELEQMAVGVKS